jgi:hypothetical protein
MPGWRFLAMIHVVQAPGQLLEQVISNTYMQAFTITCVLNLKYGNLALFGYPDGFLLCDKWL